ncbi:MAG: S66 peptidase family protein, partial [Bacteroidota bacterium]
MLTPPALKKGDTIGIVAPARSIEKKEIEPAMKMINEWGLQVITGKNLFNKHHQFSGTDRERAEDLQQMLDDERIKAILCARGGYGTVRTLQYLKFEKFINAPKWIIGFSDITAIHSYINTKLGIKTLHAQMAVNFPDNGKENQSLKLLKETLFGKPLAYSWETSYEAPEEKEISGQLTGGNLSVLYSLSGTPFDISTDGKILFLEDLDEY